MLLTRAMVSASFSQSFLGRHRQAQEALRLGSSGRSVLPAPQRPQWDAPHSAPGVSGQPCLHGPRASSTGTEGFSGHSWRLVVGRLHTAISSDS